MITKRTLRLTALILILLLLAGCGRSASQGSGTSQGIENSTASENNGSGSGQAASEDRDAQSGSSENGDNASASSAPEGEPMTSGTDRSGVYEAYAAVVLAKEAEFGKGTVTFDGLLHLTGVGYLALHVGPRHLVGYLPERGLRIAADESRIQLGEFDGDIQAPGRRIHAAQHGGLEISLYLLIASISINHGEYLFYVCGKTFALSLPALICEAVSKATGF